MSESKNKESSIKFERRNELHATVHRACKNCGAPGVWHDIPGELNKKCYDPLLKGQPVGDICPQCGSSRIEQNESKGLLWYQRIFGTTSVESSTIAKGK